MLHSVLLRVKPQQAQHAGPRQAPVHVQVQQALTFPGGGVHCVGRGQVTGPRRSYRPATFH